MHFLDIQLLIFYFYVILISYIIISVVLQVYIYYAFFFFFLLFGLQGYSSLTPGMLAVKGQSPNHWTGHQSPFDCKEIQPVHPKANQS